MRWSVLSKTWEAIKIIKLRAAVDTLQHRDTLAGCRNGLTEICEIQQRQMQVLQQNFGYSGIKEKNKQKQI